MSRCRTKVGTAMRSGRNRLRSWWAKECALRQASSVYYMAGGFIDTQTGKVAIYYKFTRVVDLWLVMDPYLEKSELLELSIKDLKAERS